MFRRRPAAEPTPYSRVEPTASAPTPRPVAEIRAPDAPLEDVAAPNALHPTSPKGLEMNQKTSPLPNMPRRFDVAGAQPTRKAESAPAPAEMRRLTVGRDISLAGEITACDQLVVEGKVEAKLTDGRRIEIAESGLFRGSVEIDEADIAGRFEGDLTVRGRLKLRGTGRISGTVRYGELEIEAGGRLSGQIEVIETSVVATAPATETAA